MKKPGGFTGYTNKRALKRSERRKGVGFLEMRLRALCYRRKHYLYAATLTGTAGNKKTSVQVFGSCFHIGNADAGFFLCHIKALLDSVHHNRANPSTQMQKRNRLKLNILLKDRSMLPSKADPPDLSAEAWRCRKIHLHLNTAVAYGASSNT